MNEDSLRPLVVLHVPPGHEIDPQALAEFQQHVETRYAASVLINPRLHAALNAERPPAPILLGHWDSPLLGQVTTDLRQWTARIFFNLDWLNLEGTR